MLDRPQWPLVSHYANSQRPTANNQRPTINNQRGLVKENRCYVGPVESMAGSPIEWNKANTQKIIQLYEKHRVLWDETYGEYKNAQSRLDALTKIADEMVVDVETVRKKITCIRSQYFREVNKMKSVKNGHTPYKSSWYGFKLLSFLNRFTEFQGLTNYLDISINGNNTDNNMKIEKLEESHNQSVQLCDNREECGPKRASLKTQRKRKWSESSPGRLDQSPESQKNVPSTTDEKPVTKDIFSSFGEYVAESLRNLHDKRLQIMARHQINNIIYNAEMSQFSNEFSSPSCSRSFTAIPTVSSSNPPSPNIVVNNSAADLFSNQRVSIPNSTISNATLNTTTATTHFL